MKTWEEETKLNKSEIINIIADVLVAILNITTAIINESIAWGMCGMLWLLIALIEYCSYKLSRKKDALIDLQDKCLKSKDIIINALLKETAVEIEISKIKIPKNFSKPKPKKMQQKYNYYRKNHKFESPIIIDTDYNLIDGYTSYLIAKECHRQTVIGRLQRKVKE